MLQMKCYFPWYIIAIIIIIIIITIINFLLWHSYGVFLILYLEQIMFPGCFEVKICCKWNTISLDILSPLLLLLLIIIFYDILTGYFQFYTWNRSCFLAVLRLKYVANEMLFPMIHYRYYYYYYYYVLVL